MQVPSEIYMHREFSNNTQAQCTGQNAYSYVCMYVFMYAIMYVCMHVCM